MWRSLPELMSDVTSLARTLRILWLAICASGGLAMAVFGYLATTSEPTMPEAAEVGFYGVALLSMVATGIAFTLIRAMERRLLQTETESEAGGIIRTFGIGALGTAEMPAIASGVAAFLTGELLVLAFGMMLFAFALLTWPSDDRVAYWLALGQRG